MSNETLAEAIGRFDELKRKPTKWERQAIARYVAAVESGDIEYPEVKRRLTRGRAIMLGGQLLIKEHIKQLEEERVARMKIHVFKIDIGKFRHTDYLRKFHAIVNELECEFIAIAAQDDKQAIRAVRERIEELVNHWHSAEAIEDATWCFMMLGTVDRANCTLACEGHGYYYSADVTLNVDFNMHSPIRCIEVTGDTTIYED